jgi:hypothetical protein
MHAAATDYTRRRDSKHDFFGVFLGPYAKSHLKIKVWGVGQDLDVFKRISAREQTQR